VYQQQVGLPEDKKEVGVMRAGTIAWASLVDPGFVETKKPLYALLSSLFMTGMVDALKDHNIFDLLVGVSQEAWEMYCISAQAVLTEHILHEPFDDEDERRAQPLFRRRQPLPTAATYADAWNCRGFRGVDAENCECSRRGKSNSLIYLTLLNGGI